MITAIDRLMRGDANVASDFVKSLKFWSEFFAQNKGVNQVALTDAVGRARSEFEELLGTDIEYARQLMSWTCFASLYNDGAGFGDNSELATRVFRAFLASDVGTTVTRSAKSVAEVYGVDE